MGYLISQSMLKHHQNDEKNTTKHILTHTHKNIHTTTITITGMELSDDNGIHIHMDRSGRASGEAFVQFKTTEDCEKALKRNLDKIGHRWVGIVGLFFIYIYKLFNINISV